MVEGMLKVQGLEDIVTGRRKRLNRNRNKGRKRAKHKIRKRKAGKGARKVRKLLSSVVSLYAGLCRFNSLEGWKGQDAETR